MTRRTLRPLLLAVAFASAAGCGLVLDPHRGLRTPAEAGLNTNNLLDPVAQPDGDDLGDPAEFFRVAERLRRQITPDQVARKKSVLCLSGGGAYGAFSAGIVCGWTCHGSRPEFDVVTGISTGALIAPLVFLGPQYDDDVRRFYTTVEKRDIFRVRPVRGLFTSSLADNAPLARLIDSVLTQDKVNELAAEHAKGRRLYIGTTELEGRRFVFWDLGAIASRGCPDDLPLIKKILLGSSAIPGLFPPSEIAVTVDGQAHYEKHGDGGVSQSIFFHPPHVPPGERTNAARDLAGTDLYMVLASKLYADAEVEPSFSLAIAGKSVSTVIYAQARGDLQRLYLISVVTGMNYHLASIPADFPAPTSSAEFSREPMTAMFNEGFRLAASGQAWRHTPPGVEPGESQLKRGGTALTHQVRGPGLVFPSKGTPLNPLASGPLPIPVTPESLVK